MASDTDRTGDIPLASPNVRCAWVLQATKGNTWPEAELCLTDTSVLQHRQLCKQ